MGGQNGKTLNSKTDHESDGDTLLPPYCKPILKRVHADHEQFAAKSFPFDELIPRWKGSTFDPNFMNAGTGRGFVKAHHIKGEGPKKRVNFERFEVVFCLKWVDRLDANGVMVRDRCYNMFTLKSPGCHDHPKAAFKDGPNKVYYSLARGEVCTWAMLKDPEAPIPEADRKGWTYVDWLSHATDLAQKELDQALQEGREDYAVILPARLVEFKAWWRLEVRKDSQQGGAQAATARGFSLLGTRTAPPNFMSRQTDSAGLPSDTRPLNNDPLPAFSQLKLNDPTNRSSTKIANNRHRFGKDASDGRPDLEAKRKAKANPNQQAKSRKTVILPENESDDFFSSTKKDRKPRRGKPGNVGQDAV